MQTLENTRIRELFSHHGIRCTRQREDIYATLQASRAHPTADELFHDARRVHPGLSLATVYNTLEIFTRRGLCRRLQAGPAAGGACRYDADLTDHLHLVTSDGRVRDVPDDLGREILAHIPRELIRRVEAEMGTRIQRVSVDFIAAAAPTDLSTPYDDDDGA